MCMIFCDVDDQIHLIGFFYAFDPVGGSSGKPYAVVEL